MSGLREAILRRFQSGLSPVTVLEDPDGLLREAGVLAALRKRGFEVLFHDDPVAFRFAYESRFRAAREEGRGRALIAVVGGDGRRLPFDVEDGAHRVSLRLAEFFPGLDSGVVKELAPEDRAELFERQQEVETRLGADETRDFVLARVFGVAPESAATAGELLLLLLQKHYAGRRLPDSLEKRLLRRLRQRAAFKSWPLARIVPEREAFFAFLQERWPLFLRRRAADPGSGADAGPTDLRFPGPVELPFAAKNVRAYLDNVFVEGFLQPVPWPGASAPPDRWMRAGIVLDPGAAARRRRQGLLDRAESALPAKESRHADWRSFARTWAELRAARTAEEEAPPEEVDRERFRALEQRVDEAFGVWLGNHYAALASLPPTPPVMLHHVPRLLARHLAADGGKVALLVLDGLALHQWVVLREELGRRQRPDTVVQEDAVFAWIPTITTISRQAAFAGRPPFHFPGNLKTTSGEGRLWRRFWQDEGLDARQVGYLKNLGQGPLDPVRALLEAPELRAAGLVVDIVDKMMHGIQLGERGLQTQIRQWTREGFLASLLELLLDRGFTVWLTSDHGNIEAEGCGQPTEGATADVRGARARLYPEEALRERVATRFPEAQKWPSVGLPSDCLPLLAPGRRAFAREGSRVVTHGGAALEEVIVPLVRIGGPGA